MIWYFTYGSNLDRERFRERVGEYEEARRATLRDHRLRFSGDVTSEGGGGAIIEPAPGGRVHGGIYAVTAEQLAAMDEVELHSSRNEQQRGRRTTITVDADGEPVRAEVYVVAGNESYRAPSVAYLGHIVRGLRDFGYGPDVIAAVEAVADAEPAEGQGAAENV